MTTQVKALFETGTLTVMWKYGQAFVNRGTISFVIALWSVVDS